MMPTSPMANEMGIRTKASTIIRSSPSNPSII